MNIKDNHFDQEGNGQVAPQLQVSFQPRPAASSPKNRVPPRRVDHTYRDYANYPLEEVQPRNSNAPRNFPSKLHEILSTHEYAHIISWMPHGRAWKINNKDLLMAEIAPNYFAQTKYESFTRQLNGWGFKRLHQSGNDFNAYYHPCFLRGLPRLTALMKRVPPNMGKLLPHVEGEPNFYEIEKHHPLPPLEARTMSYHGHNVVSPSYTPLEGAAAPYAYGASPPHMAGSAYYGAPPQLLAEAPQESQVGYGHRYPSYPSNYPPPYYFRHGDPRAAAPYSSQQPAGYPPYPAYPHAQNGHAPPHDHYHQYPYPPSPPHGSTYPLSPPHGSTYPPSPPHGSPSHHDYPLLDNTAPVPGESQEEGSDAILQGVAQEETRAPSED